MSASNLGLGKSCVKRGKRFCKALDNYIGNKMT